MMWQLRQERASTSGCSEIESGWLNGKDEVKVAAEDLYDMLSDTLEIKALTKGFFVQVYGPIALSQMSRARTYVQSSGKKASDGES